MVRPLTHDGYEVDVSGINVEFFIAYVDVNGEDGVSCYAVLRSGMADKRCFESVDSA